MMIQYRHTAFLTLLILLTQVAVSQQEISDRLRNADSLKAVSYLERGRSLYNMDDIDSAITMLESSLQLAVDNEFRLVEAENYYLLALVSESIENWEQTLRYFLKAAAIYSSEELVFREAWIYSIVGDRYSRFYLYDKSAEYALMEYSVYPTAEVRPKLDAALKAAFAFYMEESYDRSIQWYDTAYHYSMHISDTLFVTESLYGLSGSFLRKGEFEESRRYLRELITIHDNGDKGRELAEAWNAMGLLDFRLGDYDQALESYFRAAGSFEEAGLSPGTAYSNIAICYQNTGNKRLSALYLEKAMEEAGKSGNLGEKARLEHLLAIMSYNEDDIYHADYYCTAAIEDARSSGNLQVLQEVYRTGSQVKERGNDFVTALDYYERYLSLRDSLLLEQRLRDQELERRRNELETYEQQLRLTLADEQIKDLALQNLRVEAEKRENDLKLVERERELEKSEMERLQQSLQLERETMTRMMREKDVEELEKESALQRIELIQRENEERELQRQNQLLESESMRQELELEKEQEAKKNARLMVFFLALIVILVFFSFLNSRKKNQKLTAQKKEIESINTDLEKKNEEVSKQNRQILLQKEIIEEKNLAITDSIEYASRIQNAVLPPLDFLGEWGMENFIMFRPKDIVSGDFYWGARTEDHSCFAAADCTGHGVPGAFMSMLGTAYLNEIINNRGFSTAADILNSLRDEVITSLRQRGLEGETQDGMDISLCLYDHAKKQIHFSGANNPLYMVRKGELMRIDADKMPIGIHRSVSRSFTNHLIKPEPGDLLYLFSDGYADQFGGSQGKKFKYKAFRDLLLEIHQAPMAEQLSVLEDRFDRWKGDNEQVDDVMVIGVRM